MQRIVFNNPSLLEEVLSYAQSLDDVKKLSGTNRTARRARWPFESLASHSTIRAIVKGGGTEATVGRVAEAKKLSDGAIAAMIEQLCAHRALSSSGSSLLKQMCTRCAQTLRSGSRASAARAAFSCGYACVRSESGWANAHAIIGACAHAALAAIAFNDAYDLDDLFEEENADYDNTSDCQEHNNVKHGYNPVSTPSPSTTLRTSKRQRSAPVSQATNSSLRKRYTSDGYSNSSWGPRETSMWALVQLVHVAKKRTITKSLVTQLRQLGIIKSCARVLAAKDGPSNAIRELAAQLLYLTATGENEYVELVSQCDLLEDIARFSCSFSRQSISLRAQHAAQFALIHGLQLPACDRKRQLVRTMVNEARTALFHSSSAEKKEEKIDESTCSSYTNINNNHEYEYISTKARDCIACLAILAESAAEELLAAGAAELCAAVLSRAQLNRLASSSSNTTRNSFSFSTSKTTQISISTSLTSQDERFSQQHVVWSCNEPIGITAVGDAALCLEQMACYVSELEATAAEEAPDDLDELDDAEREEILAERDHERQERDRAQGAIQVVTPGLILQCLSKLNQVNTKNLSTCAASAWLRTADALVSFLAARSPGTASIHTFDPIPLIDLPHGDNLCELLLDIARKNCPREPDDPRFFFGTYSNHTILGLLLALYDSDRGQSALSRAGLNQDDIKIIEDERIRIKQEQLELEEEEEEDNNNNTHQDALLPTNLLSPDTSLSTSFTKKTNNSLPPSSNSSNVVLTSSSVDVIKIV
mmetsp:Transcript_19952/g.30366  ORF Transcript_19952/g.30366 Transcript_19952/m.30366 type:complete len:764 (+) Transcript_19952:56-2347(+)